LHGRITLAPETWTRNGKSSNHGAKDHADRALVNVLGLIAHPLGCRGDENDVEARAYGAPIFDQVNADRTSI
jgi:hypothetical protein